MEHLPSDTPGAYATLIYPSGHVVERAVEMIRVPHAPGSLPTSARSPRIPHTLSTRLFHGRIGGFTGSPRLATRG